MCVLATIASSIFFLGGNLAAQGTTDTKTQQGSTEVPLGTGSLDLQTKGTATASTAMDVSEMSMTANATAMATNGMNMGMTMMNNEMSAMMGMMGGTGNAGTMGSMGQSAMPGMTGNTATLLAQLQATNAAITQLIASFATVTNVDAQKLQLQALTQLLANQNALLQLIGSSGSPDPAGANAGMTAGGMGMMMM